MPDPAQLIQGDFAGVEALAALTLPASTTEAVQPSAPDSPWHQALPEHEGLRLTPQRSVRREPFDAPSDPMEVYDDGTPDWTARINAMSPTNSVNYYYRDPPSWVYCPHSHLLTVPTRADIFAISSQYVHSLEGFTCQGRRVLIQFFKTGWVVNVNILASWPSTWTVYPLGPDGPRAEVSGTRMRIQGLKTREHAVLCGKRIAGLMELRARNGAPNQLFSLRGMRSMIDLSERARRPSILPYLPDRWPDNPTTTP